MVAAVRSEEELAAWLREVVTVSEVVYRPHSCVLDYLPMPDRPGILVVCKCGRLWRSVYPGNPAYAGWRKVGPLYRLLFRGRMPTGRSC